MKLPNHENAIVPQAKIVDYLLSPTHPKSRGKATFFTHLGFSPDNWEELAAALLRHAEEHEVNRTEPSPFGLRYLIEGTLETPDGSTPLVRVVWFIRTGEDVPRFVTSYPLKTRSSEA